MPGISLPYAVDGGSHAHGEDLYNCALFKMLPKPVQETTRQRIYLLEYLHMLPISEVGIPDYYPQLSGALRDLKKRNLIYPVQGGLFVHVMDDPKGGRGFYITIEPQMRHELDQEQIMYQLDLKLLDHAMEFEDADTPEKQRELLVNLIDRIARTESEDVRGLLSFLRRLLKRSSSDLKLEPRDVDVIKYLMLKEKLGMGYLEPLILDNNIEDISCSGLGPIFVEHKVFRSLRTAFQFETNDELDRFVLRLSERIKKPVTFRNPIVDATLPDGSRINIVYGDDVSKRGSNFTIRKFADTPLSILELVKFGSISYEMAAYLSICLEEGMNVFVSGETASGKTTLLNAITVFIPSEAKIVTIEDTPEVQVPHPNWTREATRSAKPGEPGSGVGMFDLLKAALRQRPDEIIIGEIRGEEGLIAFQAMQTGHSCMATFHASSVEKLIQRLTGNPINVPKTYVDNLNVVVIQSAVKLPNGKIGRRALSVNEIIGYDSVADSFSFSEVFRWDPVNDAFDFIGDNNSYILEYKIAPKRGIPPQKKRQIYGLLKRRARVLEKLADKGVTNYYEFYKVISKAQKEGLF